MNLASEKLKNTIIEDTKNATKQLWKKCAFVSLGLAIGIQGIAFTSSKIAPSFSLLAQFLSFNILAFMVFFTIFLRFYFGITKHLGLNVRESAAKWETNSVPTNKFLQFLNDGLLWLNGGCIIIVGTTVGNVTYFLQAVTFLLFANVTWLLASYLSVCDDPDKMERIKFDAKSRYKPMLIWALNNMIFGLIILALLNAKPPYYLELGLAAIFFNSIIDVFFVSWYYFATDRDIQLSGLCEDNTLNPV